MTAPTLHTRPATEDDRAFVYSTWVNSYVRSVRDRARVLARVSFLRSYVDPIMRQAPRIMVLCDPDNPRALSGHAIALNGVLAWAYVPFPLREQGYARQVITAALGGYPERIDVHCRWPFESERFIFQKYDPPRATGRPNAA